MSNDGKDEGPWGGRKDNSKGNGPWGGSSSGGSSSGGGSTPPPDIEELLKKSHDKFKESIPSFGTKSLVSIIAVILLVLWASTGLYRVSPSEQGVVTRFGKYIYSTGPGLRYHLPYPIEMAFTPNVTSENREEIGFKTISTSRSVEGAVRDVSNESLMLTGDENIVDIDFTVTWYIKDAKDFLFNMKDPAGTVKIAAESAMREVIGQTPILKALTEGKNIIQDETHKLLQNLLDDYGSGIKIKRVQLLEVDPPKQVVDAFNDVQRAKTDRERLRNEADAYKLEVVPKAKGQAERTLQEAEAYRAEVTNRASGDAKRFTSVLKGYSSAKNVTARRMFLETMEKVMQNSDLVVMDPAKGGQGVIPYLPLSEIGSRKGGK